MNRPGHPLAGILRNAARGALPPPDGSVRVLGRPPGRTDAVVAFTAHAIVAADVPAAEVRRRLPPGDLGAPLSPAFLQWLAKALHSTPGVLDVVLAAVASAPGRAHLDLVPRDDAWDHPRVARAGRYRTDIGVYSDRAGRGLLVLGRGLVGRWEMSFEVEPTHRGAGLGRRLAAAARAMTPSGEPLFAQVAAGNAASLRALLSAGFTPIGAEVLFPHRG